MRVYIDLSDEETKQNLLQAVSMCCGLAVADEKDADLFVGEKVHPLLDTVIVSKSVPENLNQVVDVVLPKQSLDYYIMKFKLLYCYVVTHCSVEAFLDEEIYKSQRYDIPLSIAMVRLGKEDELAVRTLYSCAKRQARASDKVMLYDKNTLITFLPYTQIEGARIFVGRLLRHSRRIKLPKSTHFPQVVSAICQVTTQVADSSELILKLEDALSNALIKAQQIVVVE